MVAMPFVSFETTPFWLVLFFCAIWCVPLSNQGCSGSSPCNRDGASWGHCIFAQIEDCETVADLAGYAGADGHAVSKLASV